MSLLLEKISTFVPKTNLLVSLFDPEETKSESNPEFEGTTVKLTLSFKSSQACEELK